MNSGVIAQKSSDGFYSDAAVESQTKFTSPEYNQAVKLTENIIRNESSFRAIANDNSVQRLSAGEKIQTMLHRQDLADKQKNDRLLVMDNLESDTDEIYYKGGTYRRVRKGVGSFKPQRNEQVSKINNSGVDLGTF